MSKMHRILSVLLCAAVLLTLWSPAALAAGENLHEEDATGEALAQSGAQEEPKELLRQEESAEGTPEASPKAAPVSSPETTPEAAPVTSPETTPEATPEATPVTSPETTPETSAETTPEESPAESPEESPEQSPAGEYTISYDYNGGAAGALFRLTAQDEPENGTPESGAVTGNEGQIIVLAEAPVKPERDFAGWKSALTGKQYAAGEEYEIQGDDTLVAQWNMLRILEIDAQPEEGSALLECENTVSAISEEEQALVEQAVRDAQPQQDNDLLPDEDEVQVLAVDVSFLDGSGRPQQPAEGETVPMTVTVPAGALDGEGFWMVYHLVEKEEGAHASAWHTSVA